LIWQSGNAGNFGERGFASSARDRLSLSANILKATNRVHRTYNTGCPALLIDVTGDVGTEMGKRHDSLMQLGHRRRPVRMFDKLDCWVSRSSATGMVAFIHGRRKLHGLDGMKFRR
jgi:hypothetical protein